MKTVGLVFLLFVAASVELHANPVAPRSPYGFNSGWTVIIGLGIEFVIADQIMKRHLSDRREFFYRVLGVHVATLPLCYIGANLGYLGPWMLSQGVAICLEGWFYSKAPGRPKWKIALLASASANVASVAFAVISHRI